MVKVWKMCVVPGLQTNPPERNRCEKSNGFASKPTESHSFPTLFMLNIASFFLPLSSLHICNIRLPSLGTQQLLQTQNTLLLLLEVPSSLYHSHSLHCSSSIHHSFSVTLSPWSPCKCKRNTCKSSRASAQSVKGFHRHLG